MRIDGQPLDSVAALDRGFQYGDGLFETMAAMDGRVPLWESHFSRLEKGCETLGFACPPQRVLEEEVHAVAAESPRCIVKLIVTRGQGGQGYRPPLRPKPLRAAWTRSWHPYPQAFWREGIRLHHCRTSLAVDSPVAGLKHLNRLEQVLARQEWDDDEIPEGLMLDPEGHVVGGTMTNVFLVEGGTLVTPPVERCGVAGVMRGLVMELAAADACSVARESVTLQRLSKADGVFVTNAVIGIWPVKEFAQRTYPVPRRVRWLQDEIARVTGSTP
ncbi:MAG: aminodeoxychorismate lyase [Pseudomonadota bacterium]